MDSMKRGLLPPIFVIITAQAGDLFPRPAPPTQSEAAQNSAPKYNPFLSADGFGISRLRIASGHSLQIERNKRSLELLPTRSSHNNIRSAF